MTVSTIAARMRNLLRLRRRIITPAPYVPRPVSRTETRALESAELMRYDLACRRHGGAPTSGTVFHEHPILAQEIHVYDLDCPAGHTYRFKRTAGREMSAADLATRDYLACWRHDAMPVAGRVYTRDLDQFLDILVYELTCPVGDHMYLHKSDGG